MLKGEEKISKVTEVLLSVFMAFTVGAVALLILGYHPGEVYYILFKYGYSNLNYLLNKSTPLIMTGLAFSIPAIAGVFNIGEKASFTLGLSSAIDGLLYWKLNTSPHRWSFKWRFTGIIC